MKIGINSSSNTLRTTKFLRKNSIHIIKLKTSRRSKDRHRIKRLWVFVYQCSLNEEENTSSAGWEWMATLWLVRWCGDKHLSLTGLSMFLLQRTAIHFQVQTAFSEVGLR